MADPRLDEAAIEIAKEWAKENPHVQAHVLSSAAYWIAKEAHEMCECQDTILVRATVKRGAVQYRRRCLWCGSGGNSISHKSLTDEAKRNAIEYDESLHGYQAAKYTTTSLRDAVQKYLGGLGIAPDYQQYITSTEWFNGVRSRINQLDEGKCQRCGSSAGLNCHHIHYTNLGYEEDGDLVMLCRECHEEYHRQHKYAQALAQSFVIVKTAHNYKRAKCKDQHYESLKRELQNLNLRPDDYERRIFELAKAMEI